MKALSLRQPWAWLVVHGGKRIENRRWNTHFRGDFLIHAAQGMSLDEYAAAQAFARGISLAIDVPPPEELERGGIVGSAQLVGVLPPCASADGCGHRWHMPEQYGFVLADVIALDFRPFRGALGFFEVTAQTALPEGT